MKPRKKREGIMARHLRDCFGAIRYADKSYSPVRPRPISPELRKLYKEQEDAK